MNYFNPYYNQNIFGFFLQLGQRIWAFIKGDLNASSLASDELQILILIGIAVSASLVGAFLILRHMTMLANSLSHTILIGIVFVFFFTSNGVVEADPSHGAINIPVMLFASLIMGIVTAFLTQFVTTTLKLQADASTGLVFTSLFALGIILLTLLTRNAHVGTEVVMGNVDALHSDDLYLVYIVLAINLLVFFLCFKEFKMTTFDPGLSKALGISTLFFDYLLMTQTAATAVGAFRAVGVLMLLAFITLPPLTARLLTHDLKKLLFLSVLVGAAASLIGVAISRHILTTTGTALSTAGVVVCVLVLLYAVAIACAFVGKRPGHTGLTRHTRQ